MIKQKVLAIKQKARRATVVYFAGERWRANARIRAIASFNWLGEIAKPLHSAR